MPTVEEQLKFHQRKIDQLIEQQKKVRARKTFLCVCGHIHRIKDCVVIQTHWYVSPSGCTGGDYWNEGELQIVCPNTGQRNRVMFDDISKVQWDKRKDWKYSLEIQFRMIYKNLFKEVVDEHDRSGQRGFNNYYFEKNAKKFGLERKKD